MDSLEETTLFPQRGDQAKVCPYIGMMDDSGTYFAYPSPGNHCFNATPDQPVKIAYQEEYCLSDKHPSCMIYQKTWKGPLPDDIVMELAGNGISRTKWRRIALLIITGLIIISSAYFLFFRAPKPSIISEIQTSTSNQLMLQQATTALPQETIITEPASISTSTPEEPTLTFTPTLVGPTNTLTPSSIPSAVTTATPFLEHPTPGPALETPFGPENQFLLHTVKESESFGKLADTYQTSIEVIKSLNDLYEEASLWLDTVLVIMPGQKEAEGIPKFTVLLLDESTTVSDLADQYSVQAETIIYYNLLGNIDPIPAGRWLIIPINQGQ